MSAEDFYDRFVSPKLDEYVSVIFEVIAKEFLIRENRDKGTDLFIEIGRYWYNNKEEKKNIELDVVTKDEKGLTVYECKWKNRKFSHTEAAYLKEISSVLSPYRFGGFSKTGFTFHAKNDLDLTFTPKDLYH
jgi:hypothetical protein